MEMTTCMLHEKELSKKLWVEASCTVVFLLKRLPTRVQNKEKNHLKVGFANQIYKILKSLVVFVSLLFHKLKGSKLIRIQNPKFSLNTTTLQNLIEFSKDDEADKVDEMHYRSLICWLMYLNATRLDIFFYSKYTFKVYTLC